MNITHPNMSVASSPAVIGIIEALRERHQSRTLTKADGIAGMAKRSAQKQNIKAAWASLAGPVRAMTDGDRYRLVGLIRPAHEISDEDFDRQVSDILDLRDRAARLA